MTHGQAVRRAQLILVDARGRLLGQLPPVVPKLPFWSEAESLVRAVREAHGVDVTIVRLLQVRGGGQMRGGLVTYLAETTQAVNCAPCDFMLDAQPLRAAYAEVGGARTKAR